LLLLKHICQELVQITLQEDLAAGKMVVLEVFVGQDNLSPAEGMFYIITNYRYSVMACLSKENPVCTSMAHDITT
jgi:hypothetical protein